MDTRNKLDLSVLTGSFEAFLDEHEWKDAHVTTVWQPQVFLSDRPFFRIYFKSDYCPICARAHDAAKSFYQQNLALLNEAKGFVPTAFFGCSRDDDRHKVPVIFHPAAEPLFNKIH